MRNRGNRGRNLNTAGPIQINSNTQVDLQEVTTEAVEETNVVKTTDFGEVRRGTFSISVNSDEKDEKGVKKVLYENKEEPFEYDFVIGLPNVLKHAGAKLTDDQVEFLATALKNEADAEADKTIGDSIVLIVKIYNAKLKSDAKSSAYQSIVNKYKPLEGEKRETAIARMIATNVKLMGVTPETVIEMLKNVNPSPLPKDYTLADFLATPLRKTKGDDEGE